VVAGLGKVDHLLQDGDRGRLKYHPLHGTDLVFLVSVP
jgi:hypothetical protein